MPAATRRLATAAPLSTCRRESRLLLAFSFVDLSPASPWHPPYVFCLVLREADGVGINPGSLHTRYLLFQIFHYLIKRLAGDPRASRSPSPAKLKPSTVRE